MEFSGREKNIYARIKKKWYQTILQRQNISRTGRAKLNIGRTKLDIMCIS